MVGLNNLIDDNFYHFRLPSIQDEQYNLISEEIRIICKIEDNLLEIYTFDLYHLFVIGEKSIKEKKYIDKFKRVKNYRVDLNNFFSILNK